MLQQNTERNNSNFSLINFQRFADLQLQQVLDVEFDSEQLADVVDRLLSETTSREAKNIFIALLMNLADPPGKAFGVVTHLLRQENLLNQATDERRHQ